MILTEAQYRKELGGIQANMSWATVSSYVVKAERWWKNQIGKELYDYLDTLTPTEQQAELKELKELAQGVIAWYAFALAQPRLNIKIGDAGFMKMLPQNHVALTKWEYVKMEESNLSMIDICVEGFWNTLETMENQPEEWLESDSFKIRNELFIRDAAELTKSLPLVQNSVRMFEAMKTYIRKAELNYIESVITESVFEDLKKKLKKEENLSLTDNDKKLIELIKDAVALYALKDSLPYLSVLVDADGVRIVVKTDSTRNEIEAGMDSKSALIQKLMDDAKTAIQRIKKFMDKVASETIYVSYYTENLENEPFDIFSMTDDQHPIL